MKPTGLTSRQMSVLFRHLRKRGYSRQKAFKEVGIAKKLSRRMFNSNAKRVKKKYPYSDWDGDGKVNKYDCKPFNRRLQDNIGIVGTRSFPLKDWQKLGIDTLLDSLDKDKDIVVSGGAPGVDRAARWGARSRNIPIKEFEIKEGPKTEFAKRANARNIDITEYSRKLHAWPKPIEDYPPIDFRDSEGNPADPWDFAIKKVFGGGLTKEEEKQFNKIRNINEFSKHTKDENWGRNRFAGTENTIRQSILRGRPTFIHHPNVTWMYNVIRDDRKRYGATIDDDIIKGDNEIRKWYERKFPEVEKRPMVRKTEDIFGQRYD